MENKTPEELKEILKKKIIESTAKEVTDSFIVTAVFSYWWLAQIVMVLLKITKVLTCSWTIIWLPLWSFLVTLGLCMIIGILLCAKRISELER